MTSHEEKEEMIRNLRLTMSDIRFLLYSNKVSKRMLKAYYLSEIEGKSNEEIAKILCVSCTRVHQMKLTVKRSAFRYIKGGSKQKTSKYDKQSHELFDIPYSDELLAVAKHISSIPISQ